MDIFEPAAVVIVTSGEATTRETASGTTPPGAIDPRATRPLGAASGPNTAIAPVFDVAVMYVMGGTGVPVAAEVVGQYEAISC